MSTPVSPVQEQPPVAPGADERGSAEYEGPAADFLQQLDGAVDQRGGEATYSGPAAGFLHRLDGALGEQQDTTKRRISPELARKLAEPLQYIGADQTEDASDKSWEAAEKRLTEELNEGGKIKRFVSGIWKGNLLRSYKIIKYRNEAHQQIMDEQNIHAIDGDDQQSEMSRLATLDRFSKTWTNDVVHKESGEDRWEHAQNTEFSGGIKKLVERYVSGELNDESLLEEQNRFYDEYREKYPTDNTVGEGAVRIDNMLDLSKAAKQRVDDMLEIGQAVKGSAEHAESIAYVINNMRVLTAEARTGVRTGVKYSKLEGWIDNISKTKVGSFIGPETISIAASAALGIGRSSFTAAVTLTGAVGVGSGALGYMRERKRVKDERMQHSRDMAMGEGYDTGSKRREKMEETRYVTENAVDMTNNLHAAFNLERLEAGGREALEAAIAALVNAETRINLSDSRNIDLIAYSGRSAVEAERLNLDIARATAKQILRERIAAGANELFTDPNVTVETIMTAQKETLLSTINQDMTTKDEAFVKLRRRRALMMGTVGGVGSILTSVGVHAIEGGLLEGLQSIQHAASGTSAHVNIGQHGEITFTDDHQIVTHDGSIDIINKDGSPVDGLQGLPTDAQGHLSQEAISKINAPGTHMNVQNLPPLIEMAPSSQNATSSIGNYMQQPNNGTTHVTRDFWYDNNTSRIFDGNEQGLDLGGVNGSGVTADGHYQYVLNMHQGESFRGSQVAQLQQLEAQGKLKLEISASQGSQTTPFEVPAHVIQNPNGSYSVVADIDPKSPAGSLYSVENGHLQFHGAYAEAVEVGGKDVNGVTHIRPLATQVGDHTATSIGHQAPPVRVEHPLYKLSSNPYETNTDTRVSPGIAIMSRSPLENVKAQEKNPNYYYYGQESEYWERWSKERSPRLRENPDADLKTGEELSWYRKQQEELRGKEYIQEIDSYISSDDTLKSVGNETKITVCIPVAAANESENIYRTLSLFAAQDADSKKASLILLNVNWKQSLEGDPAQMQKIQKTLSEILRAKKDFPDLRISSFEKVWTDDFVRQKQGKIYGEVIKVLYDTAALALEKAVSEGRRTNEVEALLVTNDADTLGMSRNYLKNYIKTFDENPKNDVFSAVIRRGIESYKDYPGYG
ncbi:MAG: hypothetical protein JWO07_809, partial [Candidatus Saccharibacteria bacterium]|nr:hypothetical protein [Candidatus Saccharibacteria bacterium]